MGRGTSGLAQRGWQSVYQDFSSGIDFLGWVHFPDHQVLRTSTKRRMLKRVRGQQKDSLTIQSYLGMLKHGNTEKLREKVFSVSMGK